MNFRILDAGDTALTIELRRSSSIAACWPQ
jgi:hypothetical protein